MAEPTSLFGCSHQRRSDRLTGMATVLTTGRPWQVISVFAVPLLVGNLVQQLYQASDAAVVGRHLGVTSLAAVGATTSLIFLAIGCAWGMTIGFAIPTARAFGARDLEGVRRSVACGVILTGAVSVVLTVAAPLLAGPALDLLRTPESLMPEAVTYIRVTFLGTGTMMFFNYLTAVIRAIGDSRTPLVFLALSCLVNIALVVALVGGTDLGVAGAALATVIAQGGAVALCVGWIRRRIPVLRVRGGDFRVTRAELAEHLRIGVPMGLQSSIIAIGSIAVQIRLNSLGPDAVAAYTTAARVDNLALTLLNSLGLAVSVFVAQNNGGGRPDRIRQGVTQAWGLAVGVAVLLAAVVVPAAGALIRVFVGADQEQVVRLAAYGLRLDAVFYAMLGTLYVLRGALQGLGRTGIPMITGGIELAMRLGSAIVFGGLFGYVGVVWGTPLAWAGAAVLLVVSWLRAHRRLGGQPVVPVPDPVEVAERAEVTRSR